MSKPKKKQRPPHRPLPSPTSQTAPNSSSRPRPSARVDVVIPVYNQLALLEKAVATVKEHGGERLGRLVFVDDASSEPGVTEFCRKEGDYYGNSHNRGFAYSANFGARRTGTELFVLLNSDTEATPGWLDALLAMMESDEKLAIVGPLLLFPQGSPNGQAETVQSCGFAFNVNRVPYHRFIGWKRDHPKVTVPRDDLQGITGACWLVRRRALVEVGGFFEGYGSYFEDAEFGIRAKAKGWKIGYAPASVLYHRVGGSFAGHDTGLSVKSLIFRQRVGALVRYDEHLVL